METIGISESLYFFKAALGESLQLTEYQVNGVRALNYVSQNWLIKFLRFDVSYISLHLNSPLPKWLKSVTMKTMIILKGQPKIKDLGNILIRIENSWGFVVKEFDI